MCCQLGEHCGLRLAEFTFPLRHNDRRQTVPHQVDGGARHVHQLVDAEDDRDTLEGQTKAGERAGEDHQ
jgi:hypothetical protein